MKKQLTQTALTITAAATLGFGWMTLLNSVTPNSTQTAMVSAVAAVPTATVVPEANPAPAPKAQQAALDANGCKKPADRDGLSRALGYDECSWAVKVQSYADEERQECREGRYGNLRGEEAVAWCNQYVPDWR